MLPGWAVTGHFSRSLGFLRTSTDQISQVMSMVVMESCNSRLQANVGSKVSTNFKATVEHIKQIQGLTECGPRKAQDTPHYVCSGYPQRTLFPCCYARPSLSWGDTAFQGHVTWKEPHDFTVIC